MQPVLTLRRSAQKVLEGGTGRYSLMAVLIGALIVVAAFFLGHYNEPPRVIVADILREFGLVLVSVFGISYLYEKLSAEEQFKRFNADLTALIRQGETNAAMCEALEYSRFMRAAAPMRQSIHSHRALAKCRQVTKSGSLVEVSSSLCTAGST